MVGSELAEAVRSVLGGRVRKFLVTGGSGFVGSHLARALADAGQSVICTGRNRLKTHRIRHPRITFVEADIRDSQAIRQLCRRAEIVYHTAALSSPWGRRGHFHSINVEGTRNVVEGCQHEGVRRLVHVSSTAIFFDFQDRLDRLDSDPLPLRASSAYAETKLRAERVVSEAVDKGLDAFIVRARAVIGPGDNALLPRLILAAEKGRLKQIGRGDNVVDLTYIDNLVYALVLAADRGRSGSACTITNGEPAALWAVVRQILEALDLNADLRRIPYPIAYCLAGLLEGVHKVIPGLGEPLLTRYSVGILAKTQTFDLTAARRELGYRPIVPLQIGIRRLIEHLRARKEDPAATSVRFRLFSTGYTEHSRAVVLRGARRRKIRFHATFGLIEHPTEGVVLFDTGYSRRFFYGTRLYPYRFYRHVTPVHAPEEATAERILGRLGIHPSSVRYVVLSHFHADHIGGLRDFPNASFIASARAWEAVRGRRGFRALRKGYLPSLLPRDFTDRLLLIEQFHDPGMGPFSRCHDLFGDGSVRLFDLPGHCHGHLGALLQTDPVRQTFLVSDAAWVSDAIRENRRPHRIVSLILDSPAQYRATLRQLHEYQNAYPHVEMVPTHCPEVALRYGLEEGFPERSRRSDSMRIASGRTFACES
ncbi:MAG: NAD-dependent epimerase/dehydratase family protein [Planctomycetota bacterium]|nr:NAD-dependent epimerase/dehydratase family protein [Planctomycetota bacterium]